MVRIDTKTVPTFDKVADGIREGRRAIEADEVPGGAPYFFRGALPDLPMTYFAVNPTDMQVYFAEVVPGPAGSTVVTL